MSLRDNPLWSAVAHIFQETQSQTCSIQVQSVKLQRLHEDALANGMLSLFTKCFIDCLMQIVTVKRTERCADRVMAFVKQYVKLMSPSESANDDESEPWFDFLEQVIIFFLRGFTAKLAIVRYRSLNIVITLLPLAPLTDDVLDELKEKAIARTRDRDASVRGQAVIIIALLDTDVDAPVDPELLEPLLERLKYDPVAEVRRSAALNIRPTKQTLPLVLGRMRDLNTTNRRVIFTKILPSLDDFRSLSIATREKVLRSGLQDRDPTVRQDASRLLVNQWLPRVQNNIAELLQRLDVVSSPDVAELTLNALFDARPDTLLKFDFRSPEFWQEVWPEQVVMLRMFIDYARKNKLADLLESAIPELAEFADHIAEYWHKAHAEEDSERRGDLQFVVDELLRVATELDYSDEEGRRRMISVLGDILLAPSAPSDTTVAHIISVHRLLSLHDGDFLLRLCELVSDIQDSIREPDGRLLIDYDTADNAAVLTNVLTCLSVIKAGLERISSVNEHESYLDTLFSHVSPAAKSPSYAVRTRATVCANLICLASKRYSDSQLGGFYEGVQELANYDSPSEDDLELSECELLMRCMVDLMLVHKQPEFLAKIAALFKQFIVSSDSPRLTAAAAYGLAKLMLAGLVVDADIFKHVYLAYLYTSIYTSEYDAAAVLAPNRLLQQQLSLFVRAFCLEQAHKELLATVASDVYFRFCAFMREHSQSKAVLTPTKILAQIVDLTSPKDIPGISNAHAILAKQLTQIFSAEDDKKTQRVLITWMLKLELEPRPQSLPLYVEIRDSLQELFQIEDAISPGAARQVEKFLEMLQDLIDNPASNVTETTPAPEDGPSDYSVGTTPQHHTPRRSVSETPTGFGRRSSTQAHTPASSVTSGADTPASQTQTPLTLPPVPGTPIPPSPTPQPRLSSGSARISTGSSLEIVSGESFSEISPPDLGAMDEMDEDLDADMTDMPYSD